MKIVTHEIQLTTEGNTDIINITSAIAEAVKGSGLKEGMAFLFVVGSTAGLTTCEYEPGLVSDLKKFFEKLIPKNAPYAHDATWGDANGFSHLRASLLKPSLAMPFVKSRLVLGTWQQVVVIDFDNRPRDRRIVVQLQGE
jgi:secondary thiamine-phosphate synthase enzyme